MPKQIHISIDGAKTTVETEGYVGMTCLDEIKDLNLPFKTENVMPMPSKGVINEQKRKTVV